MPASRTPAPSASATRRTRRRASSSTSAGARACRTCPACTTCRCLTNTSMLALEELPRAPGHRRRQLHRARVRADVPAVRRRGHGRRDGAAPDRARGRGDFGRHQDNPRGRGHHGADRRDVHQPGASRRRRGRATRLPQWAARGGRLARPAGGRPAAEHGRPRAGSRRVSRSTIAATSRSTTRCAPTCPASGRSATAMAAARSRTRRTTTSRSWPRTCSTARRARCRSASRPTRCTSTRRSAASA